MGGEEELQKEKTSRIREYLTCQGKSKKTKKECQTEISLEGSDLVGLEERDQMVLAGSDQVVLEEGDLAVPEESGQVVLEEEDLVVMEESDQVVEEG